MRSPERLAMKLGLHPIGTRDPVSGREGLNSNFQVGIFNFSSFVERERAWGTGFPLQAEG